MPWESSSIAGYFYLAGQPQQSLSIRSSQATPEQSQQEQKLKEYIAGLEAEKRQVEQERLELARRSQQMDQEAAKKLAESQAPKDKRLREQLAVLETERRKLEQERMALEAARRETERMQAEQTARAKQQQASVAASAATSAKVSAVASAPSLGAQASVTPSKPWQPQPQPQRPRLDDRSTVLNRLAGVWRMETDGNWHFPMLQLKPGGDTLYGTLVGEQRVVSRTELTGLAVEDGNLHVRLDLKRPPEDQEAPARRLRAFLRRQGQPRDLSVPVRTVECVGNLASSQGGEIPMVCERVDEAARSQGISRKETGRMLRTAPARGW